MMLAAGVRALGKLGKLVAVSALYESAAVGPEQPDYLNAAVRLKTKLGAEELLEELHRIEVASGRVRRERWGPRTLDLDILWILGLVLKKSGLTVPHPELPKRLFALLPLLDVAPEAKDELGRPYAAMASELDATVVRRLPRTHSGGWLLPPTTLPPPFS
jgi:2-amino-4-hydroxy-6-hydroxymethyldihydropteridine diphosphokinase